MIRTPLPESSQGGWILQTATSSVSSLSFSRYLSNNSLKTVTSTWAVPSSSISTTIFPRRVICTRTLAITPASHAVPCTGAILARGVREKPLRSCA